MAYLIRFKKFQIKKNAFYLISNLLLDAEYIFEGKKRLFTQKHNLILGSNLNSQFVCSVEAMEVVFLYFF